MKTNDENRTLVHGKAWAVLHDNYFGLASCLTFLVFLLLLRICYRCYLEAWEMAEYIQHIINCRVLERNGCLNVIVSMIKNISISQKMRTKYKHIATKSMHLILHLLLYFALLCLLLEPGQGALDGHVGRAVKSRPTLELDAVLEE